MAKHTCAICGAEVGLMSGQKLADGNYICRKVCGKKCFGIFDKVSAHLSDVTDHIAQIEKGTKIFNEVILPLKKSKKKEEKIKVFGNGNPDLYVSPSTGLVAAVETRYKFIVFGKSQLACVYRIGDIKQYEYFTEDVKNNEGKVEKKHYCAILFENTTGLCAFNLPVTGEKACKEIVEYFDELFGIEKTLRNSFKNAKRQLNAIKSVAGAIKSAANDNLDEEGFNKTKEAVDDYVYGNRTEILAKADAVLAKYN